MAENAGSIYYEVEARTEDLLRGAQAANRSLAGLQNSMGATDRVTRDLNGQLLDARGRLVAVGGAAEGAGRQAAVLTTRLTPLGAAVAAVVSVAALRAMQQAAEKFTLMEARVTRLSTSAGAGADNFDKLAAVAARTGSSVESTVKVWENLTATVAGMGRSNDEVLAFVETVQKMGAVGGASAMEMSQGLRQLGQALGANRLGGDELVSVMESIPEVARQIARGMGISYGELKTYAEQGKITTAAMLDAIAKQSKVADAEFAKLPRTVSAATQTMSDRWSMLLANLDQASGTSNTIVKALDMVSGALGGAGSDAKLLALALDGLALAAASTAAVIAGRMVASLFAWIGAQANAIKAGTAQTAAEQASATAMVRRTAVEKAATLAALQLAQADFASAKNTGAHAIALDALNAAQARYAAAATAAAGAQTALSTAMSRGTVVAGALRGAMAFLGGPLGVIMLAATAIAFFVSKAKEAKTQTDLLSGAVDTLGTKALEFQRIQIGEKIAELGASAKTMAQNINGANALLERNSTLASDTTFTTRLAKEEAALEETNALLAAHRKRLEEINAEAANRRSQSADGGKVTVDGTTAGKKAVADMKEELAIAKATGAERAKLLALKKAGEGLTASERAEVERLAVATYEAETAEKSLKKTRTEGESAAKKAARERASGEKENIKTLQDLQEQLIQAGMAGETLAARQAEMSLNKYATPEQIAAVRELAAAMAQIEQRKANKELLAQVDPIAGEQIGFQTELENLRKLNEAKLIEDSRYLELKAQAEKTHELQMQALQEERFKQQAIGNEILMNSLDQLQQSATSAFTGLLTGASNSTDVVRELAGAILNEAVGAVVKLGIQQVKSIVMGQSAAMAATAAGVAQGGALASAYAPAAVAASIASFGAAAQAGLASLSTAVPAGLSLFGGGGAAGLAGGRQYGGPTSPGGAYRINENGAPEIWQDTSGRQYMMANRAGQVVSNKEATAAGGNQGVQVHVNIIQDASRAGQVSQRTEDGSVFIDAAVADVWGDGRLGKALQAKYGLRTAPR